MLAAFQVAVPVCPFAKSTIHFVSVHPEQSVLRATRDASLTPDFFRGPKPKGSIDLTNRQIGKPATRKAANIYRGRSTAKRQISSFPGTTHVIDQSTAPLSDRCG